MSWINTKKKIIVEYPFLVYHLLLFFGKWKLFKSWTCIFFRNDALRNTLISKMLSDPKGFGYLVLSSKMIRDFWAGSNHTALRQLILDFCAKCWPICLNSLDGWPHPGTLVSDCFWGMSTETHSEKMSPAHSLRANNPSTNHFLLYSLPSGNQGVKRPRDSNAYSHTFKQSIHF